MTLFSLDGTSPILPAGFHWIADDAIVVGDVEIGKDVGIWFGSMLRGDNERIRIGRGSNVQEHCVFHTDMGFPLSVGEGCTIGHRATLHGCTIGNNSLVGMSATILNGAVIGNNCLVGAGALVTEGKIFPDNSLIIGSPAKAVRELDAATIEGLRESARHYVENAKRFAAGMKPLA
jgi:carbonic anhydrase/acetyltransferase-like protein (isoleucine patch superfamily)